MAREFIDIRAPHCIAYGAEQAAAAHLKRQQGERGGTGTKTTVEQRKASKNN